MLESSEKSSESHPDRLTQSGKGRIRLGLVKKSQRATRSHEQIRLGSIESILQLQRAFYYRILVENPAEQDNNFMPSRLVVEREGCSAARSLNVL